jgi:sec-independent protein translocase protein TatA
MSGMGFAELSIIFLLMLIIFGASKLPSIGAGLGQGIRNFRRSVSNEEPTPETDDPRWMT